MFINSVVDDRVKLSNNIIINTNYIVLCTRLTPNFFLLNPSFRADIRLSCKAKLEGNWTKKNVQVDSKINQLLPNLNSILKTMLPETVKIPLTGKL